MLDHPPGRIHLTLPEWCARLVFVVPMHRNVLPVEESLPTIVAAVDFGNVNPQLSAHFLFFWLLTTFYFIQFYLFVDQQV